MGFTNMGAKGMKAAKLLAAEVATAGNSHYLCYFR